jgi:Uma2 family endonuclease
MATVSMPVPVTTEPPPRRDEPLYEVVNGKRVELPPMSIFAVLIAGRLHTILDRFVSAHGLGWAVVEALFILDSARDIRRRPDVAFVSRERWPLDRAVPAVGDWEIVPDLAVEVISPNDVAREVLGKMREYFNLGVQQVWLVFPEELQVYVYDSPQQVRIWSAPGELEGGRFLPGLRIKLAELFALTAAGTGPGH